MPRDDARLGRREFTSAAGLLLAGGAVTPPTTTDTPSSEPTPKWTSDVEGDAGIRLADVRDGLALVEAGDALVALSTEDGRERWRFDGKAGTPTLLGAAGETIYANADGTLYAVDAADGRERWYARAGRVEMATTEGTVYLGREDGVTARAVDDGSTRWRTEEFDVTGLRFHDGTVYAASRGTLYALAGGDGSRRWTFTADDDGVLTFDGGDQGGGPGLAWTAGTVADGTVFVQRAGGDVLYALDEADGSERWRADDERGLRYGLREGTVYVAGGTGVRALGAADGTERWNASPEAGSGGGQLSLAGGHLLFEGADSVHRLSFETGETRWSAGLAGGVLSEVTADVVAVGSAAGPHIALAPDDGSEFWRYEPTNRVTWYPQVADGTVFMGTDDGRVLAIDVPVAASPLAALTERVGPLPLAFGGTLLGGAILAGGYRLLRGPDRGEPAPEPVPADVEALEIEEGLGGRAGRTVHAASWPGSRGRRVALKRFPADADAEGFRGSVATWAALDDHPGVPSIQEWGTEPIPWLATAYAERGSLEAALRDGSLTTDAGLAVVADAAEAVHAAHREGTVHGNLHAGNVFPTGGDPAATVGDWGFAGTRPDGAPHVAPERRAGREGREPDARADVFSLGALAYRIATGRDPYPDGFGDAPTPPSEADPGIDPALDEPILRALAADPGERQATALAFRDALRWAAFVR